VAEGGWRRRRGLSPKPPWLDPEKVREARREARRVVREALREERGDELAAAIKSLYADVPREEWVARAVARALLGTVARKGEGTWLVYGVPELGDWHGYYTVVLEGGRYRCSCYATKWGWRRASRICTHVAAVMLARRAERAARSEAR
jgi:hypothetical protein